MKPLYLEFQAFGPYVEKQCIDFENLFEKGMFLIKGDTGSGKTTIFDAITFALYGGCSGENDKASMIRNDLEEWRCTKLLDDKISTYVYFEFAENGHKYYFKRSLEKKTKNLSTKFEAGEILSDGNKIPFFENPKKDDLNNKAIEIIGLTKEQFRQVVLLPQGQFEKFLTADSGTKEEILKKIFSTNKWDKYVNKFFDNAELILTELNNKKDEINNSLNEENVLTIEELNEKINTKKQDFENLKNSHILFNGDEKQKKLDEDKKLLEKFVELHKLENKIDAKKDQIKQQKIKFELATKAEELRELINDFENKQKDFNERNNQLYILNEKLPESKEKLKSIDETQEKHLKNKESIDNIQHKIGEYKSKVKIYENIDNLKSNLENAINEFNKVQRDFDDVNTKCENAKNKSQEDYKKYTNAENSFKDFRDRYYKGIYGEIASTLKDGEKCPVCGNTKHIELAKRLPDSVTKKQVDDAEKIYNDAKEQWEKSDEIRINCEQEKEKLNKLLNEKNDKKTKSESDYHNVKKEFIDDITDLNLLNKNINEFEKTVNEYENENEELKKKYEYFKSSFDTLIANIETAQQEFNSAQIILNTTKQSLEKKLQEKGFKNYNEVKSNLIELKIRNEIQKEINDFDKDSTTLQEQKNELANKIEPDSVQCEKIQNEIDNEKSEYNKKFGYFESEIKRLENKFTELSKKYGAYHDKIGQAVTDFKFAKELRGDTGIGLQRYILSIMFNQVIIEANRMLEKVHNGRYSLTITDEKGTGNKKGLELQVFDTESFTKSPRSVALLSGGEKFLVSLALSIGMSTIAQQSGVSIEALFIDEGFGTLDEKSIQDAMCVLESVQRSNGMIGIISHVELLEECIPTHIDVIKTKNGSRIELN